MSQCFAHLSDPHLSSLESARPSQMLNKRALGYLSWRRKRRFEHRREVLDALQRDLRQFNLDQLLVTGDLTHIGLPVEFQQAQAWLHQLGDPHDIALVPGNHDACVSAPWDETFALWQDYMASDSPAPGASGPEIFPSLRVRGDIAFIGLSTGCPKPPLMATGTAGSAQLARLPSLLEETAARGLFRVVHLHHSPIPGHEKWRKRLTDADAVHEILAKNGAELVVHGHGHRAFLRELPTVHGSAPVLAVPSASALGLHGADVASYNQFDLQSVAGGWQLGINARDYQADANEFSAGEHREISLPRSHAAARD